MLPIDTIFYDGDFDIEIFVNCKSIGSWEKLASRHKTSEHLHDWRCSFSNIIFIREIEVILFENLFKPRQFHLAVLKYSLRLAS